MISTLQQLFPPHEVYGQAYRYPVDGTGKRLATPAEVAQANQWADAQRKSTLAKYGIGALLGGVFLGPLGVALVPGFLFATRNVSLSTGG